MIPLDVVKFPMYYGGNSAGQEHQLVYVVLVPATWSVPYCGVLDMMCSTGQLFGI